jgi:hypothetical protein
MLERPSDTHSTRSTGLFSLLGWFLIIGIITGTSLFLFSLVSIIQTTQAVVLFPNIF